MCTQEGPVCVYNILKLAPYRGKPKDPVWGFFDIAEEGQRKSAAISKHCQISVSGKTERLKSAHNECPKLSRNTIPQSATPPESNTPPVVCEPPMKKSQLKTSHDLLMSMLCVLIQRLVR